MLSQHQKRLCQWSQQWGDPPEEIARGSQKLDLCQDSEISILPSAGGRFFTSPSHCPWHFSDETAQDLSLWFHTLCPCILLPLCNHYRVRTSSPYTPWPYGYPHLGPTPKRVVYLGEAAHVQLHWTSQEGLLFGGTNLCNPVKWLLFWLNVSIWHQNEPSW